MGVVTTIIYYTEDTKGESPTLATDILRLFAGTQVTAVYRDQDLVAQWCAMDDVASHYQPGRRLSIDAGGPPRARELREGVQRFFSPAVVSGYAPANLTVGLGPATLHDLGDDDELVPVASPKLSVGLWGYGSPAGWSEFQERLSSVPEFAALETELRSLIPQMQRRIIVSA